MGKKSKKSKIKNVDFDEWTGKVPKEEMKNGQKKFLDDVKEHDNLVKENRKKDFITVIPTRNMIGIGDEFLRKGKETIVPKWYAEEMKKRGQIQ